jgi:hypothetical protein
LVLDYFHTRGIVISYDEDSGIIQDEEGRQMWLRNLAQLCSQNDQSKWPDLVTSHFDALLQSFTKTSEIWDLVARYEQIENILAVRVWPEASLENIGAEKIVYRTDIAGTITILVYDFPKFVQNVRPEEARNWGKSDDELFDKALSNVLANFKPEITKEKLGDGIQIGIFSGDNFYIASHILLLDHYPDCIGKNGALVAIPHRHVMLCYPISTVEVVRAVNQLIPLILYLETQGPGSITPNLYWFHDGNYENLPYKVEDKAMQFFPPDSFVQMVNVLSK